MNDDAVVPDSGNTDSPDRETVQETPIPVLGEPQGDPLGVETGVIDDDASDA